LHVFVDFLQDFWSRMSGGDGPPGWTFKAVGLDFTKFDAADAAARNTIRSPLACVAITPTEEARGLHIDLEGRLQNILAIATGKPLAAPTVPMVAKEGLEPPTYGL
jgi:hypothetical protein